MNVPQRPHLRSGELARLAGVSPDALRHYERLKLLAAPRRSAGNYRLYSPETVERVRLIRRALALGFSLPELASILNVRDRGGAPCHEVKRLLEQKLVQLEERLVELAALRDHVRAVLKDWDGRLTQTPAGQRARLLENLALPAVRARQSNLKGRGRQRAL